MLCAILTLLHSEKLHRVLPFLSAIGLMKGNNFSDFQFNLLDNKNINKVLFLKEKVCSLGSKFISTFRVTFRRTNSTTIFFRCPSRRAAKNENSGVGSPESYLKTSYHISYFWSQKLSNFFFMLQSVIRLV